MIYIIIIILLVIIWGEKTKWRIITKIRENFDNIQNAFKNVLSKQEEKDFIKLLKILDKICVENNINYVLVRGTLLGWARYKKRIPWDDDVDVAIPKKDFKKFASLSKKFEEYGIGITSIPSPGDTADFNKIFFINNKPIPHWKKRNKNVTFPFIDIFTYSDNQNVNKPKLVGGEEHFKGPVKILRSNFEGIKVDIPSNWKWYLDTLYNNWEVECCSSPYNHRKEKWQKSVCHDCNKLQI